MDYIFTFDSIHRVLQTVKLLEQNHIVIEVIPTPRDLSSNCGMALKIAENEIDKTRILCEKNNIATTCHTRK